jgi:hypothetical protein
MQAVLTDPALCGWPRGSVIVEPDCEDLRRLGAMLRDLAQEAAGILLVYFAGPAILAPRLEPRGGPGTEMCLALPGTRHEDAVVTSLTYTRVRRELMSSRARTKVVILDCSYSSRLISSLPGGRLDKLTGIQGVHILTSSDYETVSTTPAGGAATPFTAALVDSIRAGIPGGLAVLTLGDLYRPLSGLLAERGHPLPGQQLADLPHPVPFTRNAAYERAARDGRGWLPPGRRRVIVGAGIAVAAAAAGSAIAASESHGGSAPGGPATRADPVRLVGSGDPVNRISLSHDGRYLAGGCGKPPPQPPPEVSLQIWDVSNPGKAAVPLEHAPRVYGVAFHPDGRHFATASEGGLIQMWDRATGKPERVCQHVPTAWEVAFNRDGSHLASTGSDRTAMISDVATRATLLTFPHPAGSTSGLAFSPDGDYLVTGCNDGVVRVWDAIHRQSAPRPVAILPGHEVNAIPQVAFRPRHPDTFATCSWDKTVRLWTLPPRSPRSARSAGVLGQGFFTDAVISLAFSPDGDTLATACADSVYLWDMREASSPGMRPVRTLPSPGVTTTAYNDRGTLLAATSDDIVRLWRTR